MNTFFTRRIAIIIFVIAALGAGLFVFVASQNKKAPEPKPAEPVKAEVPGPKYKVIGSSVEGRKLEAYTYGNGKTLLMFVGGIHGGYEWNSVILAYKFIDHLNSDPGSIPENLAITVIPSANPDGVYRVVGKEGRFAAADVSTNGPVGSGRLNAREVDLNRNFDCKWKPKGVWRANPVSGGSGPFSEPETAAIRNFVLENKPTAVIFWHSQSNAVYASECKAGILPETLDIMNAYSRASGYPAIKSFDSYEVTSDAEGWLASINIPAITVELKTHETVEWEQNLKGIKALFEYYGRKN